MNLLSCLILSSDSIDGVSIGDLVTLDGHSRMLQSATFLAPISVKGNLQVGDCGLEGWS